MSETGRRAHALAVKAAERWHAAYADAMEKFTAETRTTSFLVGMLREAQTPCQRCGNWTGSAVLVTSDSRSFVCDICVARTPDFEARLATRMREDKPILDGLEQAGD